jgi:hypothetical protein
MGDMQWYFDSLEKADKKYPDMEDVSCTKCGYPLVRNSVAYFEGFHFDGCPNEEDN